MKMMAKIDQILRDAGTVTVDKLSALWAMWLTSPVNGYGHVWYDRVNVCTIWVFHDIISVLKYVAH